MANSQNNIDWFRHTAPYIKAHRGKTFVVYLGNGVMSHPDFTTLIHDLALLHSLGVKLVLVHATREAINDSLSAEGEKEVFHTRRFLALTQCLGSFCRKDILKCERVFKDMTTEKLFHHAGVRSTRLICRSTYWFRRFDLFDF
mgnify:CR=1 FL=1